MKRIVGMNLVDGEIVPREYEEYTCICIKDRIYSKPVTMGNISLPLLYDIDKTFEEGKTYKFTIEEPTVINNYRVFVDGNFSNNIIPEEFNSHFIEITEYRDLKINKILDVI